MLSGVFEIIMYIHPTVMTSYVREVTYSGPVCYHNSVTVGQRKKIVKSNTFYLVQFIVQQYKTTQIPNTVYCTSKKNLTIFEV